MNYPRKFDASVASLVAKIPKRFEPAMVRITNIGGFWFTTCALISLGIITLVADKRELLPSLVAVAALTPLAELTKFVTRRKRPETLYVERMRFKTYSFPSGHSYVSSLTAGYLLIVAFAYLNMPLSGLIGIFLISFALLVGTSRVFLGAHFPSDVVAGWCLALLILYFTSPLRILLP